jgi:hypothetical protein
MSTVFTNKSGVGQADAKDGVMWAFIAMMPVMWLSVLITTFLGNVWVLKEGGHEVVNCSYLWGLIFGRDIVRERRDRGEEVGDVEVTV